MRSLIRFICCFCCLIPFCLNSQSHTEHKILNIGNRRELFFDDYLIEDMSGGAELQLHKPVMHEVVMVHDEPWEGSTCAYHVFLRDSGHFRMYYRGSDAQDFKETHPAVTCCAISMDGIHWEKPAFGIIEYQGSRENNIVWDGKGAHNFHPFIDTNPDCDPDQRYKAVGGIHQDEGLFAFCSPDGLHWNLLSDSAIISADYALDGDNHAFWDTVREEYRLYIRHRQNQRRAFVTSTSKNFTNWDAPVFLEFPGADSLHIYTNSITPYPYAPHIYIGFPARFFRLRGSIVEPLFMVSRDGVTFGRWEESIIRPGLNQERWLNRSNYIWNGILTTASDLPGGPDELSLYSNERYYTNEGVKTRRFTYRMDGFVSVNAPYSGGEMITRPFIFRGKHLHLNFSTSAAGSIMIEVQDGTGRPISGFTRAVSPELFGDYTDYIVIWPTGADVKSLEGSPVRLRFILKDADLYSLQFRD